MKEGLKVKMTFWGIYPHGKDCLYEWQFLPFGLNNALTKFLKVMDQVLARLGFAKCYIDNIIIFSSTLEDHGHHLQEVFKRLNFHKLKLHLGKCRIF